MASHGVPIATPISHIQVTSYYVITMVRWGTFVIKVVVNTSKNITTNWYNNSFQWVITFLTWAITFMPIMTRASRAATLLPKLGLSSSIMQNYAKGASMHVRGVVHKHTCYDLSSVFTHKQQHTARTETYLRLRTHSDTYSNTRRNTSTHGLSRDGTRDNQRACPTRLHALAYLPIIT